MFSIFFFKLAFTFSSKLDCYPQPRFHHFKYRLDFIFKVDSNSLVADFHQIHFLTLMEVAASLGFISVININAEVGNAVTVTSSTTVEELSFFSIIQNASLVFINSFKVQSDINLVVSNIPFEDSFLFFNNVVINMHSMVYIHIHSVIINHRMVNFKVHSKVRVISIIIVVVVAVFLK